MVRSQIVRAQNPLAIFGNEDLVSVREPIGKSVFSAQIFWQWVCVTRPNYGFENQPNSITIARLRGTNDWHVSMLAHSHQNVDELNIISSPWIKTKTIVPRKFLKSRTEVDNPLSPREVLGADMDSSFYSEIQKRV
jgi:hypothetical protein